MLCRDCSRVGQRAAQRSGEPQRYAASGASLFSSHIMPHLTQLRSFKQYHRCISIKCTQYLVPSAIISCFDSHTELMPPPQRKSAAEASESSIRRSLGPVSEYGERGLCTDSIVQKVI